MAIMQGENNVVINFNGKKKGSDVLTGATITVSINRAGQDVITKPATINDNYGNCSFTLTSTDLVYSGYYEYEWTVTLPDGVTTFIGGPAEFYVNGSNNPSYNNGGIQTPVSEMVANLQTQVNSNGEQLAEKANQSDLLSLTSNTNPKFASQGDFVDLIRNRRSYKRMRLQKTQDVSPFVGTFQLSVDDGGKHTTYSFTKDTDDDFIKINNCYVGALGQLESGYDDGVKTGTWQGTSPNLFTQTVNATVTAHVYGDTIYFNRRMNSNGGIWSITVDGGAPVQVSCWSSTDSVYAVQAQIATGLNPYTLHTIVATFTGDDPSHVPASGAGTGRGYANATNDSWYTSNSYPDIQGAVTGYVSDGALPNSNYLLDQSSNKEFAFNATYGSWTNWIPEHNGVGVITQMDAPIYLVDGQPLTFSSLVSNQLIACNDFKLIQHVHVVANGTNIAEVKFTHHIDLSGVVTVSGNFKSLVDLTMNNMYPLMLPSKQGVLNEVITGIGNSKVSINDGSDYYFTEEVDQMKSMALISSSFPNYIAAGTVENQFKTMRIGKSKGTLPLNNSIRYWQQLNAPKAYWTACQNIAFPNGSSYSWFGKLAIAEIQNIYDFVKGNF